MTTLSLSTLTPAFLNRPNDSILRDLIYHFTKFDIGRYNNVTYGLPTILDIKKTVDLDENTLLTVKIPRSENFRFNGAYHALYRRIRFSEAGISYIHGNFSLPINTQDLVPIINKQFNLQLTTDDITNIEYTSATTAVTLKANPNSRVWFDSLQVGIQDKLFAVVNLSGFKEVVIEPF
jgi:hypothetical protein